MPLVKYIGTNRKIDSVTGSLATWDPEQIREVTAEVGADLTVFTDSFIYYRADVLASGAQSMADSAIHPGEDETFDRTFGGAKCVSTAIKTADALVNSGPALLYGYAIHTAIAVDSITIVNGISAASPTVLTIPVAKAVGEYFLPVGIYCEVGIYLNFAPTATGGVTVLYHPAV